MADFQLPVSTTAVALHSPRADLRETITVVNTGGMVVYVGQSGVNTATGVPVAPGYTLGPLLASAQLFVITSAAVASVPPALVTVTRNVQ